MRGSPWLPPGSTELAAWAKRQALGYQAAPAPEWFEAWEPFDTMVAPERYYNAVTWPIAGGSAVVAEPWLAPEGAEPLARTLVAFVSHPGFVRRAAARGGEHFNTRVAFLGCAPPPEVKLGDRSWDHHLVTFAASGSEAAAAFPVAVRHELADWAFAGHLEVRPGGLIVHHARLCPEPAHLEELVRRISRLVPAFLSR